MDQVAQIREKTDIVSLLSEYITLKKAGRNFKANCPFHSEKTPSFVVSPERQIWHCFGGCNKGGDVYSFLMEYEKLEFPEALRMLAKRAGVTLTSGIESSGQAFQKESLYKINSLAKEYYHFVLTKHKAGKNALEYIKKRGINDKVIETFALGFSPATGTALSDYLIKKKKISSKDVIDAGLGFQRGGNVVDFFRGRLMFALIDHRDNVVGFSGRDLTNSDNTSKYINTRETLIYHKGEHFYGLNITKEAIRRENQVIVVEGEFDVLSCFQNGVANVVAVKGTALTDMQANLLSRFSQKITFCFDADKAGQEAIKRSLVVVEKKGLTPTVIDIPGAKDPDEAIATNPASFKKAVKEDIPIYDYLLAKALSSEDIETADGKKKIADELLPFIAQITNEIIKEHYLKKIADSLSTSYESIAKEAERVVKKETKPLNKVPAIDVKRSKQETLEEYVLALIVQSEKPKESLKKAVNIFSDSMTKERAYHKIMDRLLMHFESSESFDGIKFAQELPKELLVAFDTSLLFPLPVFSDEDKLIIEIEKAAKLLKAVYVQDKLKKLAQEIKEIEGKETQPTPTASAGDAKALKDLKKQYSDLSSHLQAS